MFLLLFACDCGLVDTRILSIAVMVNIFLNQSYMLLSIVSAWKVSDWKVSKVGCFLRGTQRDVNRKHFCFHNTYFDMNLS